MSRKEYRKARDRVRLSAGATVKAAREMLEMTQAELASKASIRQSHLSEIENGKRSVGRAIAERLAGVLDIPPAHILFSGESSRPGVEQIDVLVAEVMRRVRNVVMSREPMSRDDENEILNSLKKIRRASGS